MNNHEQALKPCPMCGCSENIDVVNECHDHSGGYYIACPECGTSTGLRYACGDDPRPLLIEAWNRRAALQPTEQPAETAATVTPFGIYIERTDGTKEFRRTGEPFSPSPYGGKAWALYSDPPSTPVQPEAAQDERERAEMFARREFPADCDWSDPANLGATAVQRAYFRTGWQAAKRDAAQAPQDFDAEFLSKRLARVAKLVGYPMPDMTHEQTAEVAGTILGDIAGMLERIQAPQGGVDLLGKPSSAGERALIHAACSRHYPRPNKLTTSAKNRHIDQCQAFEIGWAECRAAVERKQGDAPQERAAVTGKEISQ